MSAAYLGEQFDIHAGGLDLIFPHHENEIAQSCCAYDTDAMARFSMHNGYVTVDGEKMSKSLEISPLLLMCWLICPVKRCVWRCFQRIIGRRWISTQGGGRGKVSP